MRISNISGVSNTSNTQKPNFGMLRTEHIQIFEKTGLTPSNINMIKDLACALNENVARKIAVYAQVGRPEATGFKKAIRVKTAPTDQDMAEIRKYRPNADKIEYKRRSHWFCLSDPDLYESLATFISKQKGFIQHCVRDPWHNAAPFDKPKWKPRQITNVHKKIFLTKA